MKDLRNFHKVPTHLLNDDLLPFKVLLPYLAQTQKQEKTMSNYRTTTAFSLASGFGCAAALVQIAVTGGLIYVVYHFVSKFW